MQEGWKVNRRTVENFLHIIEDGYLPNSYHNNIHATDVTQTTAIIMDSLAKQAQIPKLDLFCIIIASAVHDLGHLGVNNDFLINSKHPRATTYNDKSVNENYHISRAFEVARTKKDCDIFELFTHEEQKRVGDLLRCLLSEREQLGPEVRRGKCQTHPPMPVCLCVCAVSPAHDRRGAGHGHGHTL
jgi:hypothetical protein